MQSEWIRKSTELMFIKLNSRTRKRCKTSNRISSKFTSIALSLTRFTWFELQTIIFETFSIEWRKTNFNIACNIIQYYKKNLYRFYWYSDDDALHKQQILKIKKYKFHDFREFNIIEMKNKIARGRKSNASNENIKENQQTIKFFEILLLKIVIR